MVSKLLVLMTYRDDSDGDYGRQKQRELFKKVAKPEDGLIGSGKKMIACKMNRIPILSSLMVKVIVMLQNIKFMYQLAGSMIL